MNPDNLYSKEDVKLREKQAKCSHPSFKCGLCGAYKDNLFNMYQSETDVLLVLLDHYEHLMDFHNIPHPTYFDLINSGIIKEYQKEMIVRYAVTRRKTDEPL